MPIGPLSVLLALLAFRCLPMGRRPVRLRTDLALAFLSAGILVGLGGIWLATFPLPNSVAITTSDFTEYCRSVTSLLEDTPRFWSPNRSIMSGYPATLAARTLGVVDGLLVGAWLGQALLGFGLYLWGRALHSPLAGVASAILACALVPLAALGRMLTFYPIIVGTLVFSTGLTAVYWRSPGKRTALLAGIGVALSLLVDLRGLLWALPLLGLTLLRALGRSLSGKDSGGELVLIACLLGLAWLLGPVAYPEHSTSLEVLSDLTKGWTGATATVHAMPPPPFFDGYVWGRTPVTGIPNTLLWMAEQGQHVPAQLRTDPQTLRSWAQLIGPFEVWLPWIAAASALTFLRKPVALLFFLGSALPFAVAFEGAIAARFAGLRFLANGAPLLALAGGIAVAAVILGSPRSQPGPLRHFGIRDVTVLVVLLLLVTGAIPSQISPVADWRGRLQNTDAGMLSSCPAPPHLPSQPTWVYRLP